MRYGHQPWSDLMSMTQDEIYVMTEEILEIVRQENDAGSRE